MDRDPQLDFHYLFTDELRLIVSATHPWAKAGRVDRSEMPRENYILYSKNSLTFRLVEAYFRAEQTVLNSAIELGSVEAIKEFVKLGLGVSIITPWTARKEIDSGALCVLPPGRRKLERRWGILQRKDQRLSLAEATFVGLCKSATQIGFQFSN